MKGWKDEWGQQPEEPEKSEADFGTGAPGYFLPPGPVQGWPKYVKASPNGYQKCPKCSEFAAHQIDDVTLHCKMCQESFHLRSIDGALEWIDPPAEAA